MSTAFVASPSFAQCGACGRFGYAVRMVFRNPGLETVDFVSTKSFRIKEAVHVDFRAESFNSFNNVNLGSANNSLTSLAFGTIGPAQTPRVIQFGAKLAF